MGRSERNQVPLAVVGMGCRMPGADDLDAYWRLISEGRSAIGELPADRLNRELYYDPEPGKCGKSYSQIGGVVPVRPVNPSVCPLPENLLREFDDAHLAMCEVAASAFRHAGMDPFDLALRNVGVYIGHSGGTCLSGDLAYSTGIADTARYLNSEKIQQLLSPDLIDGAIQDMVNRVHEDNPKRNLDGSPHVGAHSVASLITNAFGLTGPFMAIDAACASSLIALALGAHALQNGLIDMAVVGGASYSKWAAMVLFSMAQSMSATGSRPFDAGANGLVSSDGYAAVVLKTLPRALEDNDRILAVVRGVGISSDGRGKSLWAPRMAGQIAAINRAYEDGVNPSQLQYIECHATSTQVGDATELKALTEALGGYFSAGSKLPIGSVKANIGHTLECAGIAGFVKTVLAMNNQVIPRQINFETPNPEIDWANTPFEVATQSIPWPSNSNGTPRRAAVNAFGIGGLNVHVVIDDLADNSLVSTFTNSNGRPATADHTSISVTQQPAQDDIAIVGMGAIVPGALTVDAFWDLLVSGRDPKSEIPPERWDLAAYYDPAAHSNWKVRAKIGGFVKDFVYDWKKHKVPPKQIASANPLQFMLLDATDQALREAGYESDSFDRSRTSVVVGSVFGGDFMCHLQMGMRLPELRLLIADSLQKRGVPPERIDEVGKAFEETILTAMPALLDETGSFTASTLASRLSKTFDLMGGALSLDAADVSSSATILSAAGLLRTGSSDMVVAAAGQRSMDVTVYEELSLRNMLPLGELQSNDTLYGNVPAEGAAVVVLKRLEDARRDGNKIRGVIRGITASTNSNDLYQAYRQSLTKVTEDTGVSPSQVGILETARMSRQDLDSLEATQVVEQFRRDVRESPVAYSSISHRIGHSLGSSGMVALIKSVLELEHGQIPGGCGAEAIAASSRECTDVLKPVTQTEPVYATTADQTCVAAVANVDPKGASYHILVEGGANLPSRPAAIKQVVSKPADWRIVRISGQTADAVASRLATESADQLFERGSHSPFPADHPVRLAFVVDDAQALQQKIEFAAKYLFDENSSALERHGIFYRELSNTPPKVAFLFPGQGSQYTGMMRQVVEQVPAASEIVEQIDAALAQHGYPSFADIVWNEQVQLGSNIGFTQLSVLLADVIAFATISSLGVKPDVVAGHSFGEFAALVASGAITLDQAVQATRARTEAIEASPAHGCMLSTSAPSDKVQALLATRPENVAIACLNAPDQTVLGGTQNDIQVIQTELTKLGFQSRVIPVPCPFHTPLMAEACQLFGESLRQIQIQAPQTQFISTVTARSETDPNQIRGNLTEQMTATVRYVDVVRGLVDSGVNVLIESGPHQVLSRLNQQILDDASVSNIAFDHKRSSLEQFYRTRALLECTGALSPLAAYTHNKRIETIGTQPSRTQADGTSPESLIIHYDATERRKEKMRQAARQKQAQGEPSRATTETPTSAAPKRPAPVSANGNGSHQTSPVAVPAPPSAPPVSRATTPVAAAPQASPAPTTPAVAAIPTDELNAFMIEFIVDQTGYPEDMVDLDADLEADLGIDSIKKAQLIGELAQKYDLAHLAGQIADLSLDDFQTLRQISEFITSPGGSAPSSPSTADQAPQSTPTPPAVQTPAPAPPQQPPATPRMNSAAPAPVSAASTATPPVTTPAAPSPVVQPSAPALQPVATTTTSAPASASSIAAVPRAELESFTVGFIVDQTGYPEDMVELDADLEADLGIDSIKKAQLIGEMAQKYDLSHLANQIVDLSLDDFTTLGHIIDFVTSPPSELSASTAPADNAPASVTPGVTTTAPAPVAPAPVAPAPVAPAPVAPAPVAPAPVAPAPVAPAPVAPAPVARSTAQPPAAPANGNGSVQPQSTTSTIAAPVAQATPSTTTAISAEELDPFMINFIVDQTGYPEEMIEMDADLEADLGIDSIKKAQLIGEMAQRFELSHLAGQIADLSLDDFTTLRSISNFITQPPSTDTAASAPAASPAVATAPVVNNHQAGNEPVAVAPVANPASAVVTPEKKTKQYDEILNLTDCAGSFYEMGLAHGQIHADGIRDIMDRMAEMIGPRLYNIPELNEALRNPKLYFGDEELEELQGIADAIDRPVEAVIAHNLGLYPDYIPGCTQFAVTAGRNSEVGLIHGVNEDSPLALSLPTSLTRIVQLRRPDTGIAHLTFSLVGQIGGLNGINDEGLAVSSTLLLDRPRRDDTRHGKIHSVLVKRILSEASDVDSAVEVLRRLDRTGSWSLCFSHFKSDRLCYVEYDGSSLEVKKDCDVVLTTNHCQLHSPIVDVASHSMHRLTRLDQLLQLNSGKPLTPEAAQQALRDRYDLERGRETNHATMNTIRRVDNQISAVMLPATGEVWVTPGPSAHGHTEEFYHLNVRDLFASPPTPPPNKTSAKSSGNRTTDNSFMQGLPSEATRFMRRYALRAVETPVPEDAVMKAMTGPALIVGRNKLADAVQQKLAAEGVTVHSLNNLADPDAAIQELDQLCQQEPIRHLFVLNSCDENAAIADEDLGRWSDRHNSSLMLPFLICQRWVTLIKEGGLVADCTMTGLTASGGTFGFSGRMDSFEGGGLCGLFKGIKREVPELSIKVIDTASEENASTVAESIYQEVRSQLPQLEVGFLRGVRNVIKAIPQPAALFRRRAIQTGGTWIVTGGARGVTAVVARELGRRFNLNLHLVGSSPVQDIDPSWLNLTEEGLKQLKQSTMQGAREKGESPIGAWNAVERAIDLTRELRKFSEAGLNATYHCCDIRNRESLANVLDQVRQASGPIHGVIYGAGVENACRLEKKQRDSVDATLKVKAHGAVHLLDLTRNDPLQYFVGFGSTSGMFGGMGQADYAMANTLLCKLCSWISDRRPECKAVGIHWAPWGEVGMAMRPESRIALEASNMTFIPPLEGVAHLIDELTSECTDREVFYLDDPAFIDMDGIMPAQETVAEYFHRTELLRRAPIVDAVSELMPRQGCVGEALFDPTSDPFLLEHRHNGVPILPSVIGIEAGLETARIMNGGGHVVGVRNVNILTGMRFHTDRKQRARVRARQTEAGIECSLFADFHDRQGRLVNPNRLYQSMVVDIGREPLHLTAPELGTPPTEWIDIQYSQDWNNLDPHHDGTVYHGGPLCGLKQVAITEDGGWGKITAPDLKELGGDRTGEDWQFSPSVFDACLVGMDIILTRTQQTSQLPLGYAQISFGREVVAGEQCTVRMWHRATEDKTQYWDFVVLGEDGTVVIDVRSFAVIETRGDASPVKPETATSQPASAPAAATAPAVDHSAILQELPLISAVEHDQESNCIMAKVVLDPVNDVFLAQHLFMGRPTLPGVIGLETLVEAAIAASGNRPLVEVRDVEIPRGIRFKDDNPMEIQVAVNLAGDEAQCELISSDEKRVLYESASVEFGDQPGAVDVPELEELPFDPYPMEYPEKGGTLYHGMAMRTLETLLMQRDGGWGLLTAPPYDALNGNRVGTGWRVPAAMLDGCFMLCGSYSYMATGKRVEIPQRIGSLRFGRLAQPNEKCITRYWFRDQDDKGTVFDFVIYGANGDPILSVKGYRGSLVPGGKR